MDNSYERSGLGRLCRPSRPDVGVKWTFRFDLSRAHALELTVTVEGQAFGAAEDLVTGQHDTTDWKIKGTDTAGVTFTADGLTMSHLNLTRRAQEWVFRSAVVTSVHAEGAERLSFQLPGLLVGHDLVVPEEDGGHSVRLSKFTVQHGGANVPVELERRAEYMRQSIES